MYLDDYVVYDENGIPPFHFTKTEYKDALRHYNYNGIAYDRYPTGIEEILVDSYTWYEYEFALNELRRNIKVIHPDYKTDALRIIQDFAEGLIQ
jgi:hypothetical protein